MIDPKDLPLFERWIKSMGRAAADDPAAFAQVLGLFNQLESELRSAVPKLRAQGYSSADMAKEVDVKPSSFRERWYRPAT